MLFSQFERPATLASTGVSGSAMERSRESSGIPEQFGCTGEGSETFLKHSFGSGHGRLSESGGLVSQRSVELNACECLAWKPDSERHSQPGGQDMDCAYAEVDSNMSASIPAERSRKGSMGWIIPPKY